MSKTQYYCATTLDGYIADANDGIGWLTGYEGSFESEGADPGPMAEGGSYNRFYEGVGALVSGSTTYEWILEHASGWPYAGKPCWVLSSRELPEPEAEGADVRIRSGDVAELAEEMLASAGEGNLWIVGGGPVASQFAEAGLLDELIITVVPVILGEGKPLFARPLPGPPLRLREATPYASGMLGLRYGVPREGAGAT
jgi:dihydrofolate reductase